MGWLVPPHHPGDAGPRLSGGSPEPGERASQWQKGGEPEWDEALIPLTVPEVRRLLCHLIWQSKPTAKSVLEWSHWRRRHQARARLSHYKRRLTTYCSTRQCRQIESMMVHCCGEERVRGGENDSRSSARHYRPGLGTLATPFAWGTGQERETGPGQPPVSGRGVLEFAHWGPPGGTYRPTTGIGRTPIAASVAGGTGASGLTCWTRSSTIQTSSG